jgi:hypothetical protein
MSFWSPSPTSNGRQTASRLIPPASKLAYHERSFPSDHRRADKHRLPAERHRTSRSASIRHKRSATVGHWVAGSDMHSADRWRVALGQAAHRRIYGVLSHNPSTLPSESLK